MRGRDSKHEIFDSSRPSGKSDRFVSVLPRELEGVFHESGLDFNLLPLAQPCPEEVICASTLLACVALS